MRWKLKNQADSSQVNLLCEALNIDPILAKLLVQRGVKNFVEAKHFFRPSFESLYDPFMIKGMKEAVTHIHNVISENKNILVYGDYDVDGTTAVSLVVSYLKSTYNQVAFYIPDRYKEGYGISYQGIDFAADNDFDLIIALDCGIKAVEQVAYAKEKGIDFIICDHHRPGSVLPNAIAVLDPKRNDCTYPYKELCGCGIGFKLIHALSILRGDSFETLIPYLDLVSIAIAADIVPLTGENRILAHFGLQRINSNPRPGVKALISLMNKESLSITDVVFGIAPKINAAGRIEQGSLAVELLTETDEMRCNELAQRISEFNSYRKELDLQITQEALEQIKELKNEENFTTVVYDENWHKGVIGIVASRLIEKYYRPTLVFTKSGEKLAASARSVKGFDVYQALDACHDLLEQFGGHKYAAGLTLLPENYDSFKARFEEVVKNSIEKDLLVRQVEIDSEIQLTDIQPKFLRILKQLGPFGPQNMKPVFMATGLRDNGYGRRIGQNESHLKMNIISPGTSKTINAIGFGMGDKHHLISNGEAFKAVFTIEENHWNGVSSTQLNLKDLKKDC